MVPALLVRGETGEPSPEAVIRTQWTLMGVTKALAFGTNVSASELLTRAAKTVHTLTGTSYKRGLWAHSSQLLASGLIPALPLPSWEPRGKFLDLPIPSSSVKW